MRFFLLISAIALANPPTENLFSWGPDQQMKNGFRSAPWVRDPFYPGHKKFALKGIISGELAFVNGRWVREGDSIEGYVLRKVNLDHIVLSKNSELLVVRLHERVAK